MDSRPNGSKSNLSWQLMKPTASFFRHWRQRFTRLTILHTRFNPLYARAVRNFSIDGVNFRVGVGSSPSLEWRSVLIVEHAARFKSWALETFIEQGLVWKGESHFGTWISQLASIVVLGTVKEFEFVEVKERKSAVTCCFGKLRRNRLEDIDSSSL